jgi:hypothetical protein
LLAYQKAREIIANKKANEILKNYPLVQRVGYHADAVAPAALLVPSGQGKQKVLKHHSSAEQAIGHADSAVVVQAFAFVIAEGVSLIVPASQSTQDPVEPVALQY